MVEPGTISIVLNLNGELSWVVTVANASSLILNENTACPVEELIVDAMGAATEVVVTEVVEDMFVIAELMVAGVLRL